MNPGSEKLGGGAKRRARKVGAKTRGEVAEFSNASEVKTSFAIN